MNIATLSRLEILLQFSPFPWLMDQDNDSGIAVKDSNGNIIFFEDFGSIPDEILSGVRQEIIGRARAFGRFIVAFSGENYGN